MVNGEVSRHGGPGRYILGDHGAQRDPCAVPNADTVGDGGIDADPDVFTDPDISGNFCTGGKECLPADLAVMAHVHHHIAFHTIG